MRRLTAAMLLALAVVAVGCGSSTNTVTPNAAGEIVLDYSEFSFGAGVVEVQAGQTVTFVLNHGGETEDEFMIGRTVVENDLGHPTQFEHDFFEGLTPVVDPPSAAMGMDMDMDMDGHSMDDMDGHSMDDMDMDMDMDEQHGFMVMQLSGESARVTVTIPADAVGEWEIGCFQDKGVHWDSGMRAKFVVKA